MDLRVAIIGGGNIGSAISKGFLLSGCLKANQITITRRKTKFLKLFEDKGFIFLKDNKKQLENWI